MLEPRFVITGCARSGTLFIAEALARLGHACGHEVLYTPDARSVVDFGDTQGDVSWLAAPFVRDLAAGTVVLHQVRDPLATIRSIVGVRMFQTKPHPLMALRYRLQYYRIRFARPITNARFIRFAADHCPGAFSIDDEASRAAYYWIRWNRLIEESAARDGITYRRYRVEDLDDTLLAEFDHLLGGTASIEDVAAVRAELGTNTHRARQIDAMALDDIADVSVREELVVLAKEYGYSL